MLPNPLDPPVGGSVVQGGRWVPAGAQLDCLVQNASATSEVSSPSWAEP